MTWTPKRGGCRGKEISLSLAPQEVVTKMSVGASHNGYLIAICYIHITTTFKEYGPYRGCNIYHNYDLNDGLAYLSGYSGNDLDGLIMHYYEH